MVFSSLINNILVIFFFFLSAAPSIIKSNPEGDPHSCCGMMQNSTGTRQHHF